MIYLLSLVTLFIGFFLGRLTILKQKAEMAKAVELLYGRNIDRSYQNLKEKEFEATISGNEDKN